MRRDFRRDLIVAAYQLQRPGSAPEAASEGRGRGLVTNTKLEE